MNTLLLVRHGESEWNRQGRIQGQADSPLTARGEAQAEAVGRRLVEVLDGAAFAMYASPLSRAQRTASIIAGMLSFDVANVRTEPLLNDFNLGELTGSDGWDKVAQAHPELARRRLEDPHRFHPENGESGADVDCRLRAFLTTLEPHSLSLIVCHGVINKFIRSIRRDLHGAQIIALDESQSAIYRLDGDAESVIEATPVEALI